MCAKPARKNANKAAAPAPAAPEPATISVASPAMPVAEAAPPAWLDSADPRKRLIGKVVLVGVWLYVGALCLLALDQTFHWGIFGPKVPPLP
jgi:hypothetical protein